MSNLISRYFNYELQVASIIKNLILRFQDFVTMLNMQKIQCASFSRYYRRDGDCSTNIAEGSEKFSLWEFIVKIVFSFLSMRTCYF